MKSWAGMQRKSKLLAFQLATQTVNTLASQMLVIISVRCGHACLLCQSCSMPGLHSLQGCQMLPDLVLISVRCSHTCSVLQWPSLRCLQSL